jgi:hypothetical protein
MPVDLEGGVHVEETELLAGFDELEAVDVGRQVDDDVQWLDSESLEKGLVVVVFESQTPEVGALEEQFLESWHLAHVDLVNDVDLGPVQIKEFLEVIDGAFSNGSTTQEDELL